MIFLIFTLLFSFSYFFYPNNDVGIWGSLLTHLFCIPTIFISNYNEKNKYYVLCVALTVVASIIFHLSKDFFKFDTEEKGFRRFDHGFSIFLILVSLACVYYKKIPYYINVCIFLLSSIPIAFLTAPRTYWFIGGAAFLLMIYILFKKRNMSLVYAFLCFTLAVMFRFLQNTSKWDHGIWHAYVFTATYYVRQYIDGIQTFPSDVLIFILLCPLMPILYLIELILMALQFHKTRENKKPFDNIQICRDIISFNTHEEGLWASSQNYTDVWTRDTFFTLLGLELSRDTMYQKLLSKTIDNLLAYQKENGQIPLYYGRGNWLTKFFCSSGAEGDISVEYNDVKNGSICTDSAFQFIILVQENYKDRYTKECERSYNYMMTMKKDGLIYEHGLGSWQDTIVHKGHLLYTNVLYYQAAKLLEKPSSNIRRKINDVLWNKEKGYYKCSSTNDGFDQVGNALAIFYNLASNKQMKRIIEYRKKMFKNGIMNTPNESKNFQIYLPSYLINLHHYHLNYGWTWVNLFFIYIINSFDKPDEAVEKEFKEISDSIYKYGTVYEVFDRYGPVKTLFYNSQKDFSEAAAMYLACVLNNKLEF